SFLETQLKSNDNVKVLLLAKEIPAKLKVTGEFTNRVVCKWVKEQEVPDLLSVCDYGVLLRGRSMTNKVASPVKFAEYLSSGLKILISEQIGDCSQFVIENEAGTVVDDFKNVPVLSKLKYSEKKRLHNLAQSFFTKEKYRSSYEGLVG
ncbi:MAG TPA: hypothetical protein VII99_03885, partial [Bacteroidia bacterium]